MARRLKKLIQYMTARPERRPTFRRPSQPSLSPHHLSLQFSLMVAGDKVEANLDLPVFPVLPRSIVPVLQPISDALVANAERAAEAQGRHVSCRKGCGACCRQLVPVSEAEARFLRDLVMTMPEPRRTTLLERFAEARRRLEEAGLLENLLAPESIPEEERKTLGMTYFRLGIPCPFLEDESCSIHKERPIICREYLVTSPAENCANPSEESIQRVEMPVRISGTLSKFADESAPVRTTWVPLSLVLDWARANPDPSPPKPGAEWLRLFFHRWSGLDLPMPPSPPRS